MRVIERESKARYRAAHPRLLPGRSLIGADLNIPE